MREDDDKRPKKPKGRNLHTKRRTVVTYEDDGEPHRCRARARDGSRCKGPKVVGYEVCRMHGARGGGPVKHGRYSTRLGRFREAYEAALEDEDGLLDLRETIALLDVRVQRAAERAAEMDTPDFRARARELLQEARDAENPEDARQALGRLAQLLDRGAEEDAALSALTDVAEKLSVRQEKAWAIRLNAAQVINARDLQVIMGRFADVVMEEAQPNVAARILDRIGQEILGARALVEAPQAPRNK